jgi:hypothetical protein
MKLLARRSYGNALGKLYGNSMSGFPHRLLGLLLLTGSMASCGLGEDFGEVALKLQEPSYAADAVQSAGRANSSHMVRMQQGVPGTVLYNQTGCYCDWRASGDQDRRSGPGD